MLHEVNFLSYNKRDQVQGWIYVPAARPKGIVQISTDSVSIPEGICI